MQEFLGRSLRSARAGVSGPQVFPSQCPSVVRLWTPTGSTPECPRSLRSPGVSGLSTSSSSRHKRGASLDSCPEVPRRVLGVSGVARVSGLWTPESPVRPSQAQEDAGVGRLWTPPRKIPGRSPEYPVGPKSPPLGRPESPVWPGDSKFPELGRVSELHRSLQPSQCPTARNG